MYYIDTSMFNSNKKDVIMIRAAKNQLNAKYGARKLKPLKDYFNKSSS